MEDLGATVEWIETPEGRRLRMVRWSGGDEGLELLENVPELRWLDLSRTKITDDGLIKVGRLTKLEGLKLGQCRITDTGLAHLAGLVSLDGLSLLGTKVTVAGLDHLAGMRQLRMRTSSSRSCLFTTTLKLTWNEITDEGLAHLLEMPQIEILYLRLHTGDRCRTQVFARLAAAQILVSQ